MQEKEWHYWNHDNGPDELECPGGCSNLVKFGVGSRFHKPNCQFKLALDAITKILNKE